MLKKVVLVVLVFSLTFLWVRVISPQNSNEDPATTDTTSDQLITLDLSNENLDTLPGYVFDRTNVEELNISNNNLTGALPGEIRQLKNLKILNASNNTMTGVPAEIGQLTELEYLDLSNNKLTGLPYELGNLQNLKELNLSGNDYSQQDLEIIREKLPESTVIILN